VSPGAPWGRILRGGSDREDDLGSLAQGVGVAVDQDLGHGRVLPRRHPVGDAGRRADEGDLVRELDRHLADGTPAAELLATVASTISDDGALLAHIDAVIAANPRAVADYRSGKPVAGFFVGQVMRATGGAADAAKVTALVRGRLDAKG